MDRKEWFSAARYGMMIHWGLYSLLGGEYRGERMGNGDNGRDAELGEWAQTWFRIPCAEYEKLASAFDPIYFDADEWVRLAKDAGMGYLVITSKHHEGFALFKSECDPYNAVDATPFGRDIIKELADACHKYGVRFGLYYSQELDWHEEHGGGYNKGLKNCRSNWTNNWDFPDNSKKDYEICFRKKIIPQVTEILTKYGELSVIWFDTPGVITPEQSRELYDLVKKYQPNCLINSRIGNGCGDYGSMGDNQVPAGRKESGMLYETAATINDTWGYKSYDQAWKTPEEIVMLLSRLASRNVNFLLNVGPDGLGRIPAPAQDSLRKAGEWLKVNGEAIYGASPSPYITDIPTGAVTTKGDHLYCFLSGGEKEVVVPGLESRILVASILGYGDVPFTQENGTVKVTLPDLSGMMRPVLRLSSPGGVKVNGGLFEMPDGTFTLSPLTASLSGMTLSQACDTAGWTDTAATASWSFSADRAGEYAIEMTVNGQHGIEPVETDLVMTLNGEETLLHVRHDRDIDSLTARHHRGMIALPGKCALAEGENALSLRLASPVSRDMFRLAKIVLRRA